MRSLSAALKGSTTSLARFGTTVPSPGGGRPDVALFEELKSYARALHAHIRRQERYLQTCDRYRQTCTEAMAAAATSIETFHPVAAKNELIRCVKADPGSLMIEPIGALPEWLQAGADA